MSIPDVALAALEPHIRFTAALVARGQGSPAWSVDDLEQEGRLAALRTWPRYDPARGASFTTFAKPHVTGALFDFVRRMRPGTRSSGPVRVHSWDALDPELAPQGATQASWEPAVAVRLDLMHLLARCSPRARTILAGVELAGETQATLAQRLGLTASRVSQIRTAALKRLREAVA